MNHDTIYHHLDCLNYRLKDRLKGILLQSIIWKGSSRIPEKLSAVRVFMMEKAFIKSGSCLRLPGNIIML